MERVGGELGHFLVDGHGVEIAPHIVRWRYDQCTLDIADGVLRLHKGQVLGVRPPQRCWLGGWGCRGSPEGLFETYVFADKTRRFSIGDIRRQYGVALLTQVERLVEHVERGRKKVVYHPRVTASESFEIRQDAPVSVLATAPVPGIPSPLFARRHRSCSHAAA